MASLNSLKVACPDDRQKVKSPTGPPTKVEYPSILDCPDQILHDGRSYFLAEHKRQRSPSHGSPRKRISFPAERPDNLKYLEPFQSQQKRRCSTCGHSYLCSICSKALLDISELPDQFSEPESMEPPPTPGSILSASSSKKRKTFEATGRKYVGPKDADFEKCILIPCGMDLDMNEPSNITLTTIFGIESPAPQSQVIIRKTQEELQDIIEDLKEHSNRQYDEHALAMICTDSIILRDRNKYNNLLDETEVIKAERRDKWRPMKEGPVHGGAYIYDWNLEPDATYTVSIRMFSANDRRDLKSKDCERWLAENNSVCPYLTVEYKASEKTGKKSHAMYQTAAASMLWLHQRKQIRDALSKSLDDLRHYSITIFDTDYSISETQFEGVYYHTRTLADGKLTKMDDLKEYIEWSNAIHTWGLGPNATSFKEDIQKLLEHKRAPQSLQTSEATHEDSDGSILGPDVTSGVMQTDIPQTHAEGVD